MVDEIRCIECGEAVDVDHGDYEWTEDGILCWDCYEAECERASTLIRYSQGEKGVFRISKHFIRDDEYGEDASGIVQEILQTRRWVSTGSWRGYYQCDLQAGYVALSEGWGTAWPDETTRRKLTLFELESFLQEEGENAPGRGLYLLLEPTSNLFSTAMTIFCAERDKEDICKWLRDGGFDVSVLEEALT